MLFLLEAVCKKGFISKIEREERAVGGVRAVILRLCVARRGGRRRIEKLLDGMASAICAQAEGRAVYREDFPFSRELAERGVCEAGERELYKAKAVEILSAAAERKDRLFVAFDKSDAGLSDTLRKSAARFRYIEAEAPPDELYSLRQMLMRDGVSLCSSRPGSSKADAALIFSQPKNPRYFKESCAVLALRSDRGHFGGHRVVSVEFTFPDGFHESVPDGYPLAPIAAYALSVGALDPHGICAARVKTEK
ncbi:MAG: hypothetical protein II635_03670 [Oscillospiraceae bacterium]|nr:hypothetical protein [Oscillospiraceae bacterium]